MNCRYCGSRLPAGAMFCGECGRSVAATASLAPAALLPSPVGSSSGSSTGASPAPGSPSAGTPASAPAAATPSTGGFAHCPQCGTSMSADDIFCGECGFVARAVLAPIAAPSDNDTVALPEPEWFDEQTSGLGRMDDAPQPRPELRFEFDAEPGLEPASATAGERFVLQFSTGESVTVHGTGLIGRNPAVEPGEYVDELITILDEGKSVSKTHLEFGQDEGRFWVCDRFSTNGTVLRAPGAEPRRCEPEHRYVVERGSRVEIGDEFFVVS